MRISPTVAEGATSKESARLDERSLALRRKIVDCLRSSRRGHVGSAFSLVEILSPCPTNWKLNSVASWKWIDDVMSQYYPIGIVKDTRKKDAKNAE